MKKSIKKLAGQSFYSVLTTAAIFAQAQTSTDAPPGPAATCAAVCYTYQQLVIGERAEAAKAGCSSYVSPIDNPVVAKIRLAYDLKGADTLPGPIDYELRLLINDRPLWKQTYPGNPADGAEASYTKKELLPGCNAVIVDYFDDGGDAHFLARVGGRAFCGTDDYCHAYKEGRSFGAGMISRITGNQNRRGTVVQGNIWKSRYDDPKTIGCRCKDPTPTRFSAPLPSVPQ